MPTYEYRCKFCNYEFEEFQSMSADPLIICPKCAEPSLKRLMSSGAGLVFKGSGFYQTDYKKSNTSTNAGSQVKKPELKPESKPETKSNSKPGPKPTQEAPPASGKK